MVNKHIRRYNSIFNCFFFIIIFLLLLSCGGGGSGGGGGDGGQNVTPYSADVIETITANGGQVTHPDGISLIFPEGAVESDTDCSITEVSLPQSLPSDIKPHGKAYQIEFDGVPLKVPATINFPIPEDLHPTANSEPGKLSIYQWDGERWWLSGGSVNQENGFISTTLTDFSVFIIGSGPELHKPVEFKNTIGYNCIVNVWDFDIDLDVDDQISRNWAWVVFIPPFDYFLAKVHLPQGCYQFCAEWVIDDEGSPYYGQTRWKLLGRNGRSGPQWDYCRGINSSDLVPLRVTFSTMINEGDIGLPGVCGAGPTGGDGGDGGHGGDGGDGGDGSNDPNDIDDDGDGYTENQGDCDDDNASISPGVTENCIDEVDNDCDGLTDCGDPHCISDTVCINTHPSFIRIYNIDDIGKAYVNGELALEVSFNGDSGWVDITNDLAKGENKIRFICENGPLGGYTYGFQLKIDGKIEWEKECGTVLVSGCNNEDQTEGIVYDKTLMVTIK